MAVIDSVNRSETETGGDTRKVESLVCHGTSQVQRFDAPTASNIPFKEKQVHPNIFWWYQLFTPLIGCISTPVVSGGESCSCRYMKKHEINEPHWTHYEVFWERWWKTPKKRPSNLFLSTWCDRYLFNILPLGFPADSLLFKKEVFVFLTAASVFSSILGCNKRASRYSPHSALIRCLPNTEELKGKVKRCKCFLLTSQGGWIKGVLSVNFLKST